MARKIYLIILFCLFTPQTLCVLAEQDNIIITNDGSIFPEQSPILREGNLYTITSNIYSKTIIIEKENVIIDGKGFLLQGLESPDSRGILLYNTYNVTVKNFRISGFHYGLYLNSSTINIISGNTFEINSYAIYFDMASRENVIFNNNFYKKNMRSLSPNRWHNGVEGNYWGESDEEDNYKGVYQNIEGSDGIADRPYYVDEYNMDAYPLMGPYKEYTIQIDEDIYSIGIVSNTETNNMRYNPYSKFLIYETSEIEEEIGFCRLNLPRNLFPDEIKITIDEEHDPLLLDSELFGNKLHRRIYFTFNNQSHEIRLTLTTLKAAYEIVISVSGNGITHPEPGTYYYEEDETITIKSIPGAGWVLGYWKLDDIVDGNENNYMVTMRENHTLTAVFKETPPKPELNILFIGILVLAILTIIIFIKTSRSSGG